jgi:hypothetical protein
MAKPKKRKKHTQRTSGRTTTPRGFDFGCLPYAMALATFEFPGHLSAASVDGVAYGSVWSEAVRQTIPTISLVAQNGDELAKAFEAFNAWSRMTDPDSVEITFVFRNSGGYVLAISPEYLRLERRCLGFDRTHQAVAFAPTWFKPIDSVHPLLLQFRRHCSAPIAPFLFTGATYFGPRGVLTPASAPGIRPIPNLEPLLKFEVKFIDENEVTPESIGWLALKAAETPRPKLPRSSAGPPTPRPEDVARHRAKALAHHFPVTLERIRRSAHVPPLLGELAVDGVRHWQIEQALCNLVFSTEIDRGPHYVGLSARKVDDSIIKALRARYELADGSEIPRFAGDVVRTQVLADANALLRFLGKTSVADLARAQAALSLASALEGAAGIETSQAETTSP